MSITLNANIRSDLGKGASRRLRRDMDQVPAILFGGTKSKAPQALSIIHKDIEKACENPQFFSSVISLNVAGKTEDVILKDLQRHPAKPKVMHADFQRVVANQSVQIVVPIQFMNETTCPAVKVGGGRVSHQVTQVEVICLPADIPTCLVIDMQNVPLGGIVHLSDLEVPKGVIIKALHTGAKNDTPIANITAKRSGS